MKEKIEREWEARKGGTYIMREGGKDVRENGRREREKAEGRNSKREGE